jgi:hypothetical protein
VPKLDSMLSTGVSGYPVHVVVIVISITSRPSF